MKNLKLTNGTRGYLIKQIQQLDLNEPKRVCIDDWRGKRSLSSNALSHVWYPQIAGFTGTDIKSAKAEAKIDHGLPIILNNPEHGPVIAWKLEVMNFYNRSRENQIKIICTEAITSLFNSKEMSQYMNSLQHFWGSAGLSLESDT